MMRRNGVLVLLLLALAATVLSIVGDGSYSDLEALRQTLSQQQLKNHRLRQQVRSLEREVAAVEGDDRALEKAARNELGMARPDEMIFVFEKETSASGQ